MEKTKNDEHVPYLKRREAREAAPLAPGNEANLARIDLVDSSQAILLELIFGFLGGFALPQAVSRPRRGGKRGVQPGPAPLQHTGPPIPIHTRRYNPDVQDAEHIRDVLK
jgi:hypothetical protein